MRSIFSLSRYLVLIAVVGLLLGAAAIFIFGGIATINIIIESFTHGEFNLDGIRQISVEMIELIDAFLLGTILLITSLGLYELFIDPALSEMLPHWLSVRNIEQLKFNLVVVLVVMLIVLFLGHVAELESLAEGQGVQILALGGGIALVIAASAAAMLMLGRVAIEIERKHGEKHTSEPEHGAGAPSGE